MTFNNRRQLAPSSWIALGVLTTVMLAGSVAGYKWWQGKNTPTQGTAMAAVASPDKDKPQAAAPKGGPLGGAGPMAIPVKIEALGRAETGNGQTFLSKAVSQQSIDLRPDVMGRITRILVQSGQQVRAGQVLMTIDSSQQQARTASVATTMQTAQSALTVTQKDLQTLRQDVASAQAEVVYSGKQLQRYRALGPDESVSQTEVDAAQKAYDQAVAKRQALQAGLRAQQARIAQAGAGMAQAKAQTQAEQVNLAYYTIRAPFSGVVGDIAVKTGDYVIQNTALTSVTNGSTLELYIPIPADFGHRVRIGLPVDIVGGDAALLGHGTVFFISPRVDSASQTILMKARYNNARGLLRDQQQVRVKVQWTGGRGALTVPAMAIIQQGPKRFVMVVSPQLGEAPVPGKPALFSTKMVPITLGQYVGDGVEVLSGLAGDERIITAGIQKVAMMPPGTPVMDEASLPKVPPSPAATASTTGH